MARYMGGGVRPRRTTNYKKIPCPQCEQRFHSRKAVVEHIVEKHPDFIGSPGIWPEVWEINQQNVLKKTRQEYNSLIKQINNSLCSTEAIAEHFGITISEIFFQNLNITFLDFFSLYEYSYLSTLQEERERIVFDKIKQEICIQKRQLELQQEYDDTINKITLWLNSPKSIAEYFGILLHEDNTIVQKIDVSSLVPFEQYKKLGLTNGARKYKLKKCVKNKLIETLYKRETKPIYVFASRASISRCNYDTYRLENGKDILVIKSGMINCSEFPIPYKRICLYIYEMQYNFITQWEWREIKKIIIKKPHSPLASQTQKPII